MTDSLCIYTECGLQKACEGYDSNEDQDDADEDDSDENDIDEVEEVEEATHKTLNAEEEEEIVESDIELEGETVEPDDDPLQKVICLLILFFFNCLFCF